MKLSDYWKKTKKYLFRLFILGVTFFFFLVIYLDSLVRDEFNQQAWSIPAKVYARPLSFNLNAKLTIDALLAELKLLGYRQKIKAVNQGEYEIYRDNTNQSTLVIYTRKFKFWDGFQDAQVLELTIKNGSVVSLKDFESGKKVNFLRLDPLALGNIQTGNNEDRLLARLDNLPDYFIPALLNTEDRDFYQHWGISLKGIARAAWTNFSSGEIRQGGSTLTQQLMKSHFLSRERSLWRKAKEAIMAMLTEYHYDKEVILEAYINEVFLGQDRQTAIHGFGKASLFYFDRPIEKLNLSQVALLVGMVKGPSLYNPRRNPEQAKQRRDLVLKQMLDEGLITQEAFDEAISRNLQVVKKPQIRTSKVPAFMGYIKRQLSQEYSLEALSSQGLRLFTTLDPLLQQQAERVLSDRINLIEKSRSNAEDLQGALILSEISSGDILAMVGDRNPNYVGFNRAIDAYRQTGSVIKPFVYLSALMSPEQFNLTSKLDDSSFSLEGSDGSLWSPKNYDGKERGEVKLSQAMIESLNLATARLAISVGIENVAETIVDAGFERELPAYPSIALGAKEMSPLEVLRIYQALANGGVGVKSSGLIAVQDQSGELLQRYSRTAESRLEPESTFLTKYLLTQVTKEGTAKQIGATFPNKRFAGKTGTTNDLRDSWYAGFGKERLAVVWLGRDDNQPANLTGATGALQVWKDLFRKIDESSVELNAPQNVEWGMEEGGLLDLFRSCNVDNSIPYDTAAKPQTLSACN